MASLSKRIRTIADGGLIGLFVAAIAAPLVVMLTGHQQTVSLREGRSLASLPQLRLDEDALADFPPQFEAYFNDAFGLRPKLIGLLSKVRVNTLGVSSTPEVLIGKHGWLYSGSPLIINNYRANHPFSAAELDLWQRVLEERRAWLAARGIHYLLVFVPTTPIIYPEHLPRGINQVGPVRRLDQLLERLRTNSALTVIDLRPDLLEAKKHERIYYRRDTHWNAQGGYIGYRRILEVLGAWFPKLKPLTPADLVETPLLKHGDLARMLAAGPQTEPAVELTARHARAQLGKDPFGGGQAWAPYWECADPSLPRAVVIHDSYVLYHVRDLLVEHFRHSVCWFPPIAPNTSFDPGLIEAAHPQVVIQQMSDHKLHMGYPTNPPEMIQSRLVAQQNPGKP
jgi:hypothetical protein